MTGGKARCYCLTLCSFESEAEYQIEFDPKFEASLEGKRRKRKEVVKAGSHKTAHVIWFC